MRRRYVPILHICSWWRLLGLDLLAATRCGRSDLDFADLDLEESASGLAVLVDAGLELLEGEDWG